ncbi:MAG: YdbH domain-containing protein [Nitrospira sp.]|nr:YdbH domain-containing protein [Nitrospira sp.]MDH4302849.1 YdbH domain-containing protein [Nitrospira sp.]
MVVLREPDEGVVASRSLAHVTRQSRSAILTEQTGLFDNRDDEDSYGSPAIMLTQRYQVAVLLVVVVLCGCYLLLPLGASYVLANGLRSYGYSHVVLQLGYPGWTTMTIPVVSFQQDLGEERLLISLTDAEIQYDLGQLFQGRVNRILLRDVAIHVLTVRSAEPVMGEKQAGGNNADESSLWKLLTAGDLLRSLPILPFAELQLEHLTVFREQATGPLRKVTIDGELTASGNGVGGHLSFRGRDTGSYGLVVAGNSASTWSATLSSTRPHAVPIVSWQSRSRPTDGSDIQVDGQLRINVQELAPFIALLVPIGPELEKVTGQVSLDWAGVAATRAALGSLWEDAHTRVGGQVRITLTLPELKGVAKDIALAYVGRFVGNAAQAEWDMNPGVLLTATLNTQPRLIPDVVRLILPHGDQPVRIENKEVVKGTLYWKETPIHTVAHGPLQVTYGRSAGPLVATFETTRAEGRGNELILAEGAYQLEGVLPRVFTERLSAKEAAGVVRGTIRLERAHIAGVLLPPSSVTVKQIGQGAVFVPGATLNLSEPLTVDCDLIPLHCIGGPLAVTIRAPTVRVGGQTVTVVQGLLNMQEMETRGTNWTSSGMLVVDGVSVGAGTVIPSPSHWVTTFTADHTNIGADLQVDLPNHEGVVTARIEQSLKTAYGVLHGTIGPVQFDGAERRLSRLIRAVGPATDLLDGTVSATVDVTWDNVVGSHSSKGTHITSATARVVAENVSGYYHDYGMRGVSTSVVFRANGRESIVTAQPAALFVGALQSGIEVTNLRTVYQAQWKLTEPLPIVQLKDFQCEAFGGTITSPGLVVDLASSPSTTTVSLQNLDLAKILSVEQQRGLQGTGTLNGTLPVTITSRGVAVEDGVIEAQLPGGVIRYLSNVDSPPVLSESDTSLQLVAQALNNFHYKFLRVGVKYGETGMLYLSARLEGRNPDLLQTPPIHFNLTVQEHIPTLLKSLRLIEEIPSTIERKYRRLSSS